MKGQTAENMSVTWVPKFGGLELWVPVLDSKKTGPEQGLIFATSSTTRIGIYFSQELDPDQNS